MSDAAFREFLRAVVLVYWAGLPLLQLIGFTELARRGADPEAVLNRSVRDHLLAAALKTTRLGLLVVLPLFLIWGAFTWRTHGTGLLVAGEFLLTFVLLGTGLTTLALRMGLSLMDRVAEESAARGLFLLRVVVLLGGGGYGLALWIQVPGGPQEMVVAVGILGVALVVLGLNRTASLSPALLVRLSETLRGR